MGLLLSMHVLILGVRLSWKATVYGDYTLLDWITVACGFSDSYV